MEKRTFLIVIIFMTIFYGNALFSSGKKTSSKKPRRQPHNHSTQVVWMRMLEKNGKMNPKCKKAVQKIIENIETSKKLPPEDQDLKDKIEHLLKQEKSKKSRSKK